jgi:hypothetical protein
MSSLDEEMIPNERNNYKNNYRKRWPDKNPYYNGRRYPASFDYFRNNYTPRNNFKGSSEEEPAETAYQDDSEIPPLCELPSEIIATSNRSVEKLLQGNKSFDCGAYILPFEKNREKAQNLESLAIIRSVKIQEDAKKVAYLDEGMVKKSKANMEEAVEILISSAVQYRYAFDEAENKTAFLAWVDHLDRIQFRALTKGDSQFIVFRYDKHRNYFSSHLSSVGSYYKTEYSKDFDLYFPRLQLLMSDVVVLGSKEFFSKLTESQIKLMITLEKDGTAQEIAQKLAELAFNYSKCAPLFKPELKMEPSVDISVVVIKMISSKMPDKKT